MPRTAGWLPQPGWLETTKVCSLTLSGVKFKIKSPPRAEEKQPSEPHPLLGWPPNLDTHRPAAVVFHLRLGHRHMAISPGCLCILPSSYKDTGHIRLSFHQLQRDLILTNYVNIDPISKQCCTLRYWGLGLQHLLWRGHNSTHDNLSISFFFCRTMQLAGSQFPN